MCLNQIIYKYLHRDLVDYCIMPFLLQDIEVARKTFRLKWNDVMKDFDYAKRNLSDNTTSSFWILRQIMMDKFSETYVYNKRLLLGDIIICRQRGITKPSELINYYSFLHKYKLLKMLWKFY